MTEKVYGFRVATIVGNGVFMGGNDMHLSRQHFQRGDNANIIDDKANKQQQQRLVRLLEFILRPSALYPLFGVLCEG